MNVKQIILKLVSLLMLTFTVSLLISFIGCEGEKTATPIIDIASSNSIEDETINDDNGIGGDGDNQSDPRGIGGEEQIDPVPPPAPRRVILVENKDNLIENRDNVSDSGDLKLSGVTGVTTAVIGGTTYLFVTGSGDDGFSVFSVADDGRLINKTNVSDGGDLELAGASDVTTAEVEGTTYLFVAGLLDDGFSVFSVADDGTVINTTNVSDKNDLKIRKPGQITTAEVNGKHYFFVIGGLEAGFSVFSVANDGTVKNTDNMVDNGDLLINSASGIATAEAGRTTYLFVTGVADDGFSMFRVTDDGSVMNTTNVSDTGFPNDGDPNTLKIKGSSGVTTAEVGGTTYLFMTGLLDDGFSVFSVADDGTLVNTTNVSDDGDLLLDAARGVTTAEVGGITYLFVMGFIDDGFSVFSVANDGKLVNTANVSDDDDLELNAANAVAIAEVGGTTYLFVTGFTDSGLSVFNFESLVENP